LPASSGTPEEEDRIDSLGLLVRSVVRRTGPEAINRPGDESFLEDVELVLEGELASDLRLEFWLDGRADGLFREPRLSQDGRAHVFLRLCPGEYDVSGNDPEAFVDPARFRVGPGEPKVVVLRVTRQVVSFALRPDEDRRPVHHLEDGVLILRRLDGGEGAQRKFGSAVGPDGAATFSGLPPGEYAVWFTWPEGETVYVGQIEPGTGRSLFEFLVPAERR
jgi:hypothetical protein